LILLIESLIDGGTLWSIPSLEPYLLRQPDDPWTHNAFTIENAKRNTDSPLKIFYLGGSLCKESITTAADIEQALIDVGSNVAFFNLTAHHQTFTQNSM